MKRPLFSLGSAVVLVACGGHDVSGGARQRDGRHAAPDVARQREAVVYDGDARVEVYEASESARRAASATAALIPRALLDDDGRVEARSATVGDLAGACDPVRFSEQPAAAFCSAALVDRDLVLTAAHCLRAFSLADFDVVFDYLYTSESELALTAASRYAPVEILAERMDPASTSRRYEFAWLRLDRAVTGREPVAPRTAAPLPLEPLVVVSTTEGAPLKVDAAARVVEARASFDDFFVADSDTFHGSSGGGAFDANGALLGVLARGAPDYEAAGDRDCTAPNRLAQSDAAEEFSRVDTALSALCAAPLEHCPAICERGCAEPSAPGGGEVARRRAASAGCSFARGRALGAKLEVTFLVLLATGLLRRVAGRKRVSRVGGAVPKPNPK